MTPTPIVIGAYTVTREAPDCWCIRGSEDHRDPSARGRLFDVVTDDGGNHAAAREAVVRLGQGRRPVVVDVRTDDGPWNLPERR